MKSLILIAVVFAAAAVNAEPGDIICPELPQFPPRPPFDPIKACEHCLYQESYNQYTVCPSNHTIYYHCEMTRGTITAHQQLCPRCFGFSTDTWGCTEQICGDVDVQEPFTENIVSFGDCCFREADGPEGYYKQFFKKVTDPQVTAPWHPALYYYWVVNGWPYLMPCPDGTYFDSSADKCQCVHCYPGCPGWPCLHSDTKVFCLDFENDGAERGIWYNQDSTCAIEPRPELPGPHTLRMPGGPCDIEVPYFANNEFKEFKLCGKFNTVVASLEQGLAFNGGKPGDDCYPGSIEISLKGGYVFGEIKTDGPIPVTTYRVDHYMPILSGNWYEVCLKYNGSKLELSVAEDGKTDPSPVWTYAQGTTMRNKCNLMFGASFDGNGNQHFFQGNIDDWCFWRAAN